MGLGNIQSQVIVIGVSGPLSQLKRKQTVERGKREGGNKLYLGNILYIVYVKAVPLRRQCISPSLKPI